jgi:hypothetical protein
VRTVGEDENHKLNPEYRENLVFPKSTTVSVGSKSTAKQVKKKIDIGRHRKTHHFRKRQKSKM